MLAVIPFHILHRKVYIALEVTRVAAHHGLPQGLGYLGLADVVVGEGYLMHGRGIADSLTTHHEGTAIDLDHREGHTVDEEVALGIARGGAAAGAAEQYVDQFGHIADLHVAVAVNVGSRQINARVIPVQ